MTRKRKSFVLHKDSLDILPDLTDEQAGKLFKAIYSHQIDEAYELDQITKMVFLPFKNQFKRDNEKYEETCERRAIAGSKGGKQKVANTSKCKQKVASVADSVSKSKSKSKSKSDSKDIVNTKKYNFSEVDIQCAEWVYRLIKNVAPSSKQPNTESWANTIRLMREVDRLTHQDIKDVFTWANKDSFWSTNILSITKLRKQFPQLQAKMKGANNGSTQNTSQKLSAHERVKQRNDAKYRQPDECGLGMGANDGHMGRTMDEGERRATIEHVDSGTFIDYE